MFNLWPQEQILLNTSEQTIFSTQVWFTIIHSEFSPLPPFTFCLCSCVSHAYKRNVAFHNTWEIKLNDSYSLRIYIQMDIWNNYCPVAQIPNVHVNRGYAWVSMASALDKLQNHNIENTPWMWEQIWQRSPTFIFYILLLTHIALLK